MTKFNVVLEKEGVQIELESKKAVAAYLAEQGIQGSLKTIEKNVTKALKNDGKFNEDFTIAKIEEEANMETANVENEVKNDVEETQSEEIVYDDPNEEIIPEVNIENLQTAIAETTEPGDVPNFNPEIEIENTSEEHTESDNANEETPAENVEGKVEEVEETIDVQNLKDEYVNLVEQRNQALDTNQAILVQEIEQKMNELRKQIEVEDVPVVDEIQEVVEPENVPSGDSEKPEVAPVENKRRVGKGVIAYKNGEELEIYPSIKACATAFKEIMNLQHMPFTPIMKSVRQDVDWNEYSFKMENEADLHIPESLKKKIEESQKAAQSEKPAEKPETESTEQPVAEHKDEVIEEIVEEIIEEPVAEEIK